MKTKAAPTKARFEAATKKLQSLAGRIDASFYEYGRELRSFLDEGLLEAGGYTSFRTFVETRLRRSYSTARSYVKIVQFFEDEDFAVREGLDRLRAYLGYLTAAGRKSADGIERITIEIHGQAGGRKKLLEATVTEIKAATTHLRTEPGTAPEKSGSNEAKTKVTTLNAKLTRMGSPARAVLAHDPEIGWVVTVRNVPVDKLNVTFNSLGNASVDRP